MWLAFAVPAQSNAQALDLFGQWLSAGLAMDLPPKADLIVPFFKNVAYPLGVFGFIVLTFFVIRYGWGYPWVLCVAATGFFFIINGSFSGLSKPKSS